MYTVCKIDLQNGEVTTDGTVVQLRQKELLLLECFCRNIGKTLRYESIIQTVWGEKGSTTRNLSNTISNMKERVPALEQCIIPDRRIGYKFILPSGFEIISYHDDTEYEGHRALPHIITRTAVFESDESVICRNVECRQIEAILRVGKSALLLSGFGGIGKTALAGLVYTRVSDRYETVGWIEYSGTLKDSFLSSVELYNDIEDQDKRWNSISHRLKNDRSSKLFVIDNVDKNASLDQDPILDSTLQEILAWRNTSVLLTSRLREISGYRLFCIESLGNIKNPKPCIDLFYHYYTLGQPRNQEKQNQEREDVLRLIRRAEYHTYAIELLARSAAYEDDLRSFADRIEASGFQFPSLRVSTKRGRHSELVAEQLRLLFDMRTRCAEERQILWDFAVLPEHTTLNKDEVYRLLGYTVNDLDSLCCEGWVRFSGGRGFNIHPLVRECVHLGADNGKAPAGTAERLVHLVMDEKLIGPDDSHAVAKKKIELVESATRFLKLPETPESAQFFYKLGMLEYQSIRKRLTALRFLDTALEYSAGSYNTNDRQARYWLAKLKYQRGYIKSTTHIYRKASHEDLQEALEIWRELEGCRSEVAMASDHLGYVLSEEAENFALAKDLLENALEERKKALEMSPSQQSYRDYATTCDNLGCLLEKTPENIERAKELLIEAYNIRKEICQISGKYETDVAWTAFNLGQLWSKNSDSENEDESHLRESLTIRREQEKKHPSVYVTNVVFTLVKLARLLSNDVDRIEEVKSLLSEASQLKEEIDIEHSGYFSEEILSDLQDLVEYVEGKGSI